jgi:hypothetical protein
MAGIATVDRRVFVSGCAGLLVAGALPALAAATDHPEAEWLVVDRRFLSLLPRQPLARRTLAIDGDVTALWRDTLQPLWRERGAVIAGITREPALFCLEHLAQGLRHHLLRREALAGTDAVRWTLAPVGTRGLA